MTIKWHEYLKHMKEVHENKRQMVMLAGNKPLQKLVCVWPMAPINLGKPKGGFPESTAGKLTWVWGPAVVDMEWLTKAVGIGPDVHDLFNQARAACLIWPDGTIHKEAEQYLKRVADSAVFGMGFAQGWPGSVQHDGEDG